MKYAEKESINHALEDALTNLQCAKKAICEGKPTNHNLQLCLHFLNEGIKQMNRLSERIREQ